MIEGIIYRYRAGIPWRDLPESCGPWQTDLKRHRRVSSDGTWDRIHTHLLARADAGEDVDGELDWDVSVDSTVNRAHQHSTNMPRQSLAEAAATGPGHTGGSVE